MNKEQLDILQNLFENDPVFREFVANRLKERSEQARKKAEMLEGAHALMSGEDVSGASQESSKATKNKLNHRQAIMMVLNENKSGMTVSDIRSKLAEKGHTIQKRTLNTLLGQYRDTKDVKSEGETGSFIWSVV